MDSKKDKDKKQVLLRLSPRLWEELADWAEDDFRSINGQIEYLLNESVKQRKKTNKKINEEWVHYHFYITCLFQIVVGFLFFFQEPF